jgi:hypothetical protein
MAVSHFSKKKSYKSPFNPTGAEFGWHEGKWYVAIFGWVGRRMILKLPGSGSRKLCGSLASVEGGWRAAAGSQSATWNRLREKVLFFLKIA